jgi:hypothetical protein
VLLTLIEEWGPSSETYGILGRSTRTTGPTPNKLTAAWRCDAR